MARLVNMLAFERRCIRSSFVVLPAAYRPVRLGPTPCWRGASTLSMLTLFPSRTILCLPGNSNR
jgi:hypothetical protein